MSQLCVIMVMLILLGSKASAQLPRIVSPAEREVMKLSSASVMSPLPATAESTGGTVIRWRVSLPVQGASKRRASQHA